MADCLSGWAYLARKAWMNISMHGHGNETTEAKRIIGAERLLEEGQAKCFVVMGSRADLAQVRDAKVQAVAAQMKDMGDRRMWYEPLNKCRRIGPIIMKFQTIGSSTGMW